MATGYDKTICRMPDADRFATARSYVGRDVIVRANRARDAKKAEYYPGRVLTVAFGQEGAKDVLILVMSGPKGVGMPPVAFNLAMILSIAPAAEEGVPSDA
jgi:Mrp family chromosome partitioning ATPase